MTRRVIQTDLFAAFKESQQRAERQLGHKRKIRVEGTSVRKEVETHSTDEQMEVVNNTPRPTVVNRPTQARQQTHPTKQTPPTTAPSSSSSQHKTTTSQRNDRVTISYQKAKQTADEATARIKVTPKAESTPADNPTPTYQSSAPRRTPTSSHHVSDGSGTLMTIALLIVTAAAAFIIGQKTAENKVVTIEKKEYLPAPETTAPEEAESNQTVPSSPALEDENLSVLPADNTSSTTPPVEEEESTTQVTPPLEGKYSIMVVSGIDLKQAQKVANLIEQNSTYKAYVREYGRFAAVYAGRFKGFNSAEAKECQNFCKNLEFEGRRQFYDAFRTNLPKSLLD